MEEADRILLLILAIVVTFLLWNATRIALGIAEVPDARPVANLLSGLFSGGSGTEIAERVLVWSHLLVILGFLVFLPGSKHLHIATAPANVWLAKDGPTGRLEPNRIDLEAARGGHPLRRRDPEGPVEEADARPVLVHRVRPVPGGMPGVGDRQAALAEAADHGPPRPRGRRGRRRGRAPAARPERRDRPGRVGLRDVRRVRARVPGRHRAHRHDRRPAPEPRDGRVAVPAGGRPDAPRRREPGEPVGPAGVGAARLGEGPRRAGAAGGRPGAGGPVLGRVRGRVRRARAEDDAERGEVARRRGHRLGGARPAREVHRRPRPADGPRVPVPDARRAERRDAERRRRDEDRRELRALLQHARERVPRLRRDVRGRAPHAAAVRADRGRATPAADRRREDHVPRRLLPRSAQRRVRRAPRR